MPDMKPALISRSVHPCVSRTEFTSITSVPMEESTHLAARAQSALGRQPVFGALHAEASCAWTNMASRSLPLRVAPESHAT